jgi:hypothetical protein
VRYEATTEVRGATPKHGDLPFNLDDMLKAKELERITGSFDIMKDAINYILNNQNQQSILIHELLEASRDSPNAPFTVVAESGQDRRRRSES